MILRDDFNVDCIYLDNAATTLKPKSVVESYINNFYLKDSIERHRERVAHFLNVPSNTIKFTRGTTNSLNMIAKHFKDRVNSVSIPISAHHSNLLPWQRIAKLNYIELNNKGEMLEIPASDLISVNHVSNVLGTIYDLNRLELYKNSVVVVDGAQAPSHMKIDLSKINCDFYAFSSHKMYGPTGLGVLYDRGNVIEESYSNYRAVAAFATALDYLEDHFNLIIEHEKILLSKATKALVEMGIKVYGTSSNKAPIISFSIENIHPHDIASFLNEKNIAIRAGHHCAQPLMDYLDVNSTSRVSFGIYNDESDIDKFIEAVKECILFFR